MKDQVSEAAITAVLQKAAVAQKVAVSGGVASVFGGLAANEVAALGGLAIAGLGLLVQLYYKRKADRRAEELHRYRIKGARFPDEEEEA